MKNESGIFPSGNRLLVKPDEIEKKSAGGIIIPETEAEKHAVTQTAGILVAVGKDCWKHKVETVYRVIDGQKKMVEERHTGYSAPFAKVGDRVMFAKFGGLRVVGQDGETYRILNDEDITTTLSEGVKTTDLEARKRMGT